MMRNILLLLRRPFFPFWFVAVFGTLLLQPGFSQQTGQIQGLITDANTDEPLAGVNIILENTNMGAASDNDGYYLIQDVPPGQYLLLVNYIGFQTQSKSVDIVAGERTVQNFALKESILEMNEIVVTGTGAETRKKELTTAVSTISAREIDISPTESIDKLLLGRVAGGQIKVNAGMPGTGSRIQLRGVTSANASQTPVIYVDGVRIDNNDNFRLEQGTGGVAQNALSDILTSDVEKVEVIKGGAASTLYGSEAANGVIQIFTKKGDVGPPRFSFKMEQGFNAPETKYVQEKLTEEHVLETGYFQKYSATLDGGGSFLTYHLSGYVMGDNGVLPEDDNQRYAFRSGLRIFPSDELRIHVTSGFVRDNYQRMYNNNASVDLFGSVEQHSPDFFGPDISEEDAAAKIDEYALPNLTYAVNRFNFGTTVHYDPYESFTHRFTVGMDYRKNEERQFIPIAAEEVTGVQDGGLFRSDREYMTVTVDYAGTIHYPHEGLFTSKFTYGAQGFRVEDRESNVSATQFGLPGTDDFDNTANQAPLESNRQIFSGGVFINEQIGFRDKLFFNAGLRVDGNTAFGDEISAVTYPKFGVAYTLSDEAFWKGYAARIFSLLKFRASYGETGNFPTPFSRDRTFIQGSFQGAVAANFGNPGDDELGPERTKTFEYGLETSLLSDRVGLEFSIFDETTTDALFLVPSQPASGLSLQLRNVGQIENSGVELALNAQIYTSRNFNSSLRATFTKVENKVTDLGGAQAFSVGGFSFLPQRVEKGKPVGVFRTNVPNADGRFETVLEKSPLPDFSYSLGLNLDIFRRLRLSFLGDGQKGGYSGNLGKILRFLNGGEVQDPQIPEGHNFVTASDIFIEDATFFKLREISASYRLPRRYFNADITLQASLRNAYIWSKADDFDPELNGTRTASVTQADVGGFTINTISPPRQFRFAIQFNY